MANNKKQNKPAAKPAQAKPESKKTPKTPKAPKAPTTVETVETVEPTTVEPTVNPGTVVNALTGHMPGNLDANRRMDMITNMRVMFHDDPRARQNLGDDIVDAIDDITRAGLVCALADYAVNGDDAFAAVLKASNYPALIVAADKMGVKLPALKALPSGKEEGTVVLDTSTVEVSKETEKKLKEEKKIEDAGNAGNIELDPVKVAHMSESDLKAALEYILITGPKQKKSVKDTLTSAVDFMHAYRIEQARQAENSTDAMNKIEDRTMREELHDVFSYVTPTYLLMGIGRGLYTVTKRDKSPLAAFLIMRNAMLDKATGVVVWDDQSIADATHAIIELICNSTIATETKAIEELDKKKDAEIIAKHQAVIDEHTTVLEAINNISFDIVDSEKFANGSDEHRNTRGSIIKLYFPTYDAADMPLYKNLFENVTMRAGIILNLFRSPDNHNQNYSEANVTELEKYTLEEYEKLQAEKKKEELKAKKEESKKD